MTLYLGTAASWFNPYGWITAGLIALYYASQHPNAYPPGSMGNF